MRMRYCVVLVFFIVLVCCPLPVQAKNLTYASDFYLQGNDLVNKGQYEDALQAYRTARSMDERFYNEHYGISYQIGWVLNKQGRYDEALTEFQIAEKYRPEWVAPFAIYYNEGCVLARLGRNEEALNAFDSALLYGNTNWFVLYNKGIVLSRMGRYADAVTAFDTSRKAYGSYLPLLGSYQDTVAAYDRARGVAQSGTDAPVHLSTGRPRSIAPDAYNNEWDTEQLMRTGRDFVARYEYENALVAFDRVLQIDSSNYQAMDWKGTTLANLGRYSESEMMYNKSLLYLDSKLHEDFYIDVYYGKGWVAAQQGNYEEAIRSYDKLFIVDPDVFRAHYDKAWVLSRQGKYAEAATEYNRSLDWENQERIDSRSYTILGPLGTYQDIVSAYDKTKNTQSMVSDLSSAPSYDVVIYQTDFSTDPGWQTSSPRLYYWDRENKTYHFKSDASPGYAEMKIPYNETPFRLEYDITIPHADAGALVRFGLTQYNISENSQKQMIRYNSQNVILGEFKSWRANSYRSIKDGDKTFQITAIDNQRFASDPEYEGMCRINREESIAIPSFGENRIYHVSIAFDPVLQTISTRVSDNLHEKTYYVCSGMLSKTGTFHFMDRLILVAEPGENAYFEGSIDNVVLTIPGNSARTISPARVTTVLAPSEGNNLPAAGTVPPVITPDISPPEPSGTGNAGGPGILPGIFSNPTTLAPVILLILVVIALFIAADFLNRRKQQ